MPLFDKIAGSIRQQILDGTLRPGDPIPSVRDMSEQWSCAPGTVQRAYRELAAQGLIDSQVGQGSWVAERKEQHALLRRATLLNQVEGFALSVLAAGFTPVEIAEATREVLARWQARTGEPAPTSDQAIRFVGSHDPIISLLARRLSRFSPGYSLQMTFAGSLGGLIALARYGADIAGVHLWDDETEQYNTPFVKRFLPGRQVALLTLAERRLGLIVPGGNPADIAGLEDLIKKPGLRFVNRQAGAGTRVWLDSQLAKRGIDAEQIEGYQIAMRTHLEVAGEVAAGRADVGLGIEAAALAHGMGFVPLTTERYDLVIPAETWEMPVIQSLVEWLITDVAQETINAMGGYDVRQTGRVEWIE